MPWYDHTWTSKRDIYDPNTDFEKYIIRAKKLYNRYYSVPNMKITLLDILKKWEDEEFIQNESTKITLSYEIKILMSSISDNVLGSLVQLDYLISIIKFDKLRTGLILSELLVELFICHLLPPYRHLISIYERSFKNTSLLNDSTKKTLAMWYFEHDLKALYKKFIVILQNCLLKETNTELRTIVLNYLLRLSKFEENKEIIIQILKNNSWYENFNSLQIKFNTDREESLKNSTNDDFCIVISDSDEDCTEISINKNFNSSQDIIQSETAGSLNDHHINSVNQTFELDENSRNDIDLVSKEERFDLDKNCDNIDQTRSDDHQKSKGQVLSITHEPIDSTEKTVSKIIVESDFDMCLYDHMDDLDFEDDCYQ